MTCSYPTKLMRLHKYYYRLYKYNAFKIVYSIIMFIYTLVYDVQFLHKYC